MTLTLPGIATPRRLLLVLGCALGLQAWLFWNERTPALRPLFGDEIQYHSRAIALAEGHPLPPDFIWPPLGSWFLAAVYVVAGPSRLAVEIVQVVLFFAAGLLLRFLARKALGDDLGADVTLALFLLDPQVAAFAHYLWPEILHLVLMLGALALLFAGDRPRPSLLLGAGLLLGLALLTKNLLGPFVPVLLVAAALRRPTESLARRTRRAALVLAGVGLAVLPVVIRNGVLYETFAIADSGPMNLWIGITDPAGTSYDRNVTEKMAAFSAGGTTLRDRNRKAWGEVRREVERRGVVSLLAGQLRKQYVRLFDRRSFFTDQLPGGRIATGEANPSGPSWSVPFVWSYAIYAALLTLAAFGAVSLTSCRLREGFAVPVLFLAYNLGLFLFLHVKTRYRIPFLPSLDLLAAFFVVETPRFAAREEALPARIGLRMTAGAALAGSLLYAAFSVG